MEKDDAIKAVSTALATLLSATACSASSPANPNISPVPELSTRGRHVAVGAQCSLYHLGVKDPVWPRIYDPVIETGQGALGPDGRPYLYSCTKATTHVSVGECQIVPTADALSCNRVDGKGTIYGSRTTPPARIDSPVWEESVHRIQKRGAGWSTGRQN